MTILYRCNAPLPPDGTQRCRAPITGIDHHYEHVPSAANPEDAPLAAMGMPVGSIPTKWTAVWVDITHWPCGHTFRRPVP